MFGFEKRRRARLRAQPWPDEWQGILERTVPYTSLLTQAERLELQGHVHVFLDEKAFEGCDGLEITDEIRVTIAAQACILLLHRETDYYPTLQTVLVYPRHYFADISERLPDGTVVEGSQGRLGESWFRGAVVLSWSDVIAGAADPRDGHNVVFHEFAHQLDSESGAAEGAPDLGGRDRYAAWARVLSHEYERLLDDLHHHRHTFLDRYAGTNPAEFFAVVTEAFFERPVALAREHPALYDQLKQFYAQDPASRLAGRERRQPGPQGPPPAGGA